ncbi:MAG TPA: hypothetical protein VL049_19290 [Candidatus Dormibacteraeota bacterium]|nr:hypothetical protein [Candidatus Dormibacteraeota bacterium]
MQDRISAALLQPPPGRRWLRVLDTAEPSPRDILAPGKEVAVRGTKVRVRARSVVVLRSA